MTVRVCPKCHSIQSSASGATFERICPSCGCDIDGWYIAAAHNSKIAGKNLSGLEIQQIILDEMEREGEIALVKETNFTRITESPENLAETLVAISDCCGDRNGPQCNDCPLRNAPCGRPDRLTKWLQEECE